MNIKLKSNLEFKQQRIYLEKLQDDLQNLNDDRIHLIDNYLKKIFLYSDLTPALISVRQYLMENSNPELYKVYIKVKTAWISYLGHKVRRMEKNSKKLKPEWLLMNEHLQDVLSVYQIVAENKFEEGFEPVGNDLKNLIRRCYLVYFPCLKQKSRPNSGTLDQLIENLEEGLKMLKVNLETNFESLNASKLVKHIHDLSSSLNNYLVKAVYPVPAKDSGRY